jgi:hypothetical protein
MMKSLWREFRKEAEGMKYLIIYNLSFNPFLLEKDWIWERTAPKTVGYDLKIYDILSQYFHCIP